MRSQWYNSLGTDDIHRMKKNDEKKIALKSHIIAYTNLLLWSFGNCSYIMLCHAFLRIALHTAHSFNKCRKCILSADSALEVLFIPARFLKSCWGILKVGINWLHLTNLFHTSQATLNNSCRSPGAPIKAWKQAKMLSSFYTSNYQMLWFRMVKIMLLRPKFIPQPNLPCEYIWCNLRNLKSHTWGPFSLHQSPESAIYFL